MENTADGSYRDFLSNETTISPFDMNTTALYVSGAFDMSLEARCLSSLNETESLDSSYPHPLLQPVNVMLATLSFIGISKYPKNFVFRDTLFSFGARR